MGDVNFYLKKPEKTGKSLVYLQFKYKGFRFKYSFGQTIDPKEWNARRQRVKSSAQTTADGTHSLNELMDHLSDLLQATYRKELANGIPTNATLKAALDAFIYQNHAPQDRPTLFKLIDRFICNEINFQGKKKAENTIKKYKTAKSHLMEFQRLQKYPVDFETINLDFFYQYVSFLKSHRFEVNKDGVTKAITSNEGLGQNTIAKDIQVIKTFMSEAVDLGYTKNISHKHKKFSAVWVDVDAVYLNERELMDLFLFDFSNDKRLDQVRDLFVFGCYTGLRFSDYSSVRPENLATIDGEIFLKIVTKKTGQLVIIPCNQIVLRIFEKYKDNRNRLPKAISNQKFNDYVKDVCKKAGLTEKGRLVDEPDKELWQCVSSHTARRSFATNLYLEGFPTTEIRKITGHQTEKSFNKYVKVSKLDAAKKLSLHHKKKNWSELLLKVA